MKNIKKRKYCLSRNGLTSALNGTKTVGFCSFLANSSQLFYCRLAKRYIAYGVNIKLIHFSFIPLEDLNSTVLNSLEDRYKLENVLTFETVGELKTFVELLGAELLESPFLSLQDIDSSWLINGVLKSFSEPEFESFYQKWITVTGRDNNMDEYGQLICFNSSVSKLNKAAHRVVLQNAI